MGNLHVAKLRLEARWISAPIREQYGLQYTDKLLWSVYIDDELVSDRCAPFLATDSVIELVADTQVPDWAWGLEFISARLIEDYVLWVDLLQDDKDYFWLRRNSNPLHGMIYCFDANSYAQDIDNIKGDNRHYPRFRRSQISNPRYPPELSVRDLRQMLTFPETCYAIYRIPERDDDPWGAEILGQVRKVIEYEELDMVRIIDLPGHFTELRIGFEEPPNFYECVWHISKTEQGVAIRFVERPYFPFWLCGAAFDKALGAEPFLSTGASL